jgi:hypothetical protein
LAKQQLVDAMAAWETQRNDVQQLRGVQLSEAAAEGMGIEVRAAATGELLLSGET